MTYIAPEVKQLEEEALNIQLAQWTVWSAMDSRKLYDKLKNGVNVEALEHAATKVDHLIDMPANFDHAAQIVFDYFDHRTGVEPRFIGVNEFIQENVRLIERCDKIDQYLVGFTPELGYKTGDGYARFIDFQNPDPAEPRSFLIYWELLEELPKLIDEIMYRERRREYNDGKTAGKIELQRNLLDLLGFDKFKE
jgi:hypothetical protein